MHTILVLGVIISLVFLPQILMAEVVPIEKVLEKSFDVGRVTAEDSPQIHDFIIMNTGEMDLEILSITPG
jgi:hypothetical protein